MEERNKISKEAVINRGHEFLKEWKRRRKEDENFFLQEINTAAHKKRMERLQGKTIKNGTTPNS